MEEVLCTRFVLEKDLSGPGYFRLTKAIALLSKYIEELIPKGYYTTFRHICEMEVVKSTIWTNPRGQFFCKVFVRFRENQNLLQLVL